MGQHDRPVGRPAEPAGVLFLEGECLRGAPDRHGRYLTYIVEHGDNASEEDYSVVGNYLPGAVARAARDYGYEDFHPMFRDRYYTFVGTEYDDPLVARLRDGTLVAVTSRSIAGMNVQARSPTAAPKPAGP